MPLIFRIIKGAPLTFLEGDNNLRYLETLAVSASNNFSNWTGSILSQFAGTSSLALTASYALNAGTTVDTGSLVSTSSFNSFTSSYYQDSSSFDQRINSISFDSSSLVSTASFNSFTASYNTGSFTGSFSGSLYGTSSWAESASFATTASYALNVSVADLSIYTLTSSFNGFTSSYYNDSSSFDQRINSISFDSSSLVSTSSFNNFTASYNTGSFSGSFTGSFEGTASWANNSLTASFITASNIQGPHGSNSVLSSSFAISSSWAPMRVGGSDTQIQFNSGSTFSGNSDLRYDYSARQLIFTNLSRLYSTISGSVDGFDFVYEPVANSIIGLEGNMGMRLMFGGSGMNVGGGGTVFPRNSVNAMVIAPITSNVLIGNNPSDAGYKLHVSSSGDFGSLNVDGILLVSSSLVTISGSLDVSGSGKFTNGLQVTRSLIVTGSEPVVFSTTGDILEVSGSFVLYGSASISGPTTITNVLTLPYQDPLPNSPATGSIALSGSGAVFIGMFVWTGQWQQI